MNAMFPPPPAAPGRHAEDARLVRRARLLARRAAEEFGVEFDFGIGSADPRAGLTELRTRAAARLCALPSGSRAGLAGLYCELDRLAGELCERALIERARQIAECERGLSRLRELTTSAGLIDGVCDELVRSLGCERAMIARVEDGMWRPWKGNAALFEEAWVAEWIETAIPLDELTLETRLLTERRPALILDTTQPGIAGIVRDAGVRSYVVAPIMPGGQVVGFFHADHGATGRTCDEVDRDLLWTFAEGFGHLYERVALQEQLHTRTEQVRQVVTGLTGALDALSDADLNLAPDGTADARPAALRPGELLNRFSARELEVFDLLVAGARNAEIADRLGITVGTVKSHVKNILAKIGVVNRSQAIATYLAAAGGHDQSIGV